MLRFEIDPNTYDPKTWCVEELICLRCLKRAIHVYNRYTPLKNLECDCGAVGYLICTGQDLEPFIDGKGEENDQS